MNVLNRMMSYDKTKNVNQKCDCTECKTNVKNQIAEYPLLTEEEIEQIINERYSDKDEKTKSFIRKALRKHGDKYDYFNVVYVKATEKVEIICRIKEHGLFSQTPDKHLQGRGCKKCQYKKLAKIKKSNTKEFIEKANKVHGKGTYNYSKTDYINNNTKVIIICPKHGEFIQKPNHHLGGEGCPNCGIEKRAESQKSNTKEFIEKSNKVHGEGTYDYSKVDYVSSHKEVIIICPIHGEFSQTPSDHLSGKGCSICGINKSAEKQKLTLQEFIEKSNKVHGIGTYIYSKVVYINARTEVTIICPKHGEFSQSPYAHMNGNGCPKCKGEKLANERRKPLEKFIEESNEIHGIGTYDYSKVDYINACTNVIIICPKHGEFSQIPRDHLNGKGCPKCNKNKGEESVRKFLTEKGIEFEEQKKFEGCKYKKQLRIDFYIPQYNLCIESDGNPHFEKINWNNKLTDNEMEKELKLNQYRDNIKNEYCKKNGITLLRVNNLQAYEEVEKYFQDNNLLK